MQPHVNITVLRAGSAILIGFGVIVGCSAWPPLAGFIRFLVDLFAWPLDGTQNLAASETRLMMAIAGGVMAGWGAMIWMATTRLVQRDPSLLRALVLIPGGIWFVVDSIGSVASGVPVNALVNTGFLLLFVSAFVGKRQTREA